VEQEGLEVHDSDHHGQCEGGGVGHFLPHAPYGGVAAALGKRECGCVGLA